MSSHRFFIVGREEACREWDPFELDEQLPRDMSYFAGVMRSMSKRLAADSLHVYVTWSPDELPEYGAHVVALLVGEEFGLVPRYVDHVRLVAKVMGCRPVLGLRGWRVDWLAVLLLLKYLRNWCRHIRSVIRKTFAPRSWPRRVSHDGFVLTVPWGSASLPERPVIPIGERLRPYFFSGGIRVGTDVGFRRFTGGPKIVARSSLVRAVQAIEAKYPAIKSASLVRVHSEVATAELGDRDDYASALMGAKVCLAPRGTVADTWRLFEGMKYGCVVITNLLPSEWYYQGAPVIQLERWSALESVLIPLLTNDVRLEQLQREAADYWANVCGEDAVGTKLAEYICRRRPMID